MGVHGGPDIVEDGLVFAIDAANRQSYPGTGTVCTDTISNESGTLSGNASFQNSNNVGEFILDGVNDYINFGDLSKADFGYQVPFTFNVWFKLNDSTPLSTTSHLYTVFSKYQGNNINGGYALFLRGGSSNGIVFRSTYASGGGAGLDTNPTSDMSSTFTDYKYHSATFTYNSSALGSLYVDGQFINSRTLGTGQSHNNGMNFYIGVYSSINFDFPGNIGPLRIYNRELSAAEVLHNYNSLKSRFE